MIQVYSKGNTKFDTNGDMVLFPKSCKVSAELNGTWKMTMVHPRDQEGRWKYLEEECIISAPTFMGEKQLFRIREIDKTNEEVTVTALPVFLDSEDDCFLMDVRPTAKNGQEALNIMTAGSKYSGESNITTAAAAYFVERNLPDAINGTSSPTFIERWGGEILYDNYKVIINERVGGDYGVEVRYGKNMEGIDYTLDMSGVVTRIVPMAYNGYKMSGNTPWVDSPNINKYEKKYIRKIKFEDVKMREDAQEDDEEKGVIICDTQAELNTALTAKCREVFENGLDLPVVSIEITMINLSGTEEYKDYHILETVGLGDDIRCRHKELGITTKERVVAITWDCCRKRADKVTLGETLYDYFSDTNSLLDSMESILGNVSGAIADDGSVIAGKVKGFLDATMTQIRLQNSIAQKQVVRAILFEDLDPESELYGAMALGTLGLQIAKRRTADGRDWDWTTALTANGLVANIIVAGILSDKRGLNFWNLDTGEFSLSATGFTIDGQTADNYFKDNWTQKEIFDKLTNNGSTMGIYLSGGKLYLNAAYMQLGKLTDKKGKNFWDLETGEFSLSASSVEIEGQAIDKYFKDNLTQIEVFNKLTNNGATMGVYMSGGKLYLNAAYMQIGKISSKNGKVYFDLDNNELACSRMISPIVSSSVQSVVDVGYPAGSAPTDYTGSMLRIYSQGYPEGAVRIYANSSGVGNISGPTKSMNMGCAEIDGSGNNGGSKIHMYPSNAEFSANYQRSAGGYGHAEVELRTVSGTVGGSVRISPYLSVGGGAYIGGALRTAGEKNRIAQTMNYGERLLYSYETPSPMFGDVGEGVTDENGECCIGIDHVFSETVNVGVEYQVFLQKEGPGDIWIAKKDTDFFVVSGTAGLKFSWELKAVQREYEYERLEEFYGDNYGMLEAVESEMKYLEQEWLEMSDQEEEQEDLWCGTIGEIEQERSEQEDMLYGITQELYGY